MLKKADAILIDDDILIQLAWKMVAKRKGKSLQVYAHPKEFLEDLESWDRSTPLYIDSDLGNGLRGEDLARQAYDRGFTEIFLCTGYPASQFSHLVWLKGVIGKESPWL